MDPHAVSTVWQQALIFTLWDATTTMFVWLAGCRLQLITGQAMGQIENIHVYTCIFKKTPVFGQPPLFIDVY
jgi:hypothetical protein